MTDLKILAEGYARKDDDVLFASPSSVLIRDSGLNILVDPGLNKRSLLVSLDKEDLRPEDIDLLFLTHHHLDHILNVRLFPESIVCDGFDMIKEDRIISYSGKIPNTNIKVIPTPGHSSEHCSLMAETEMGKIVVAGDVFWWMDDEIQETSKESLLGHKDPFVADVWELVESRNKLIEIADFIIPGHGKMFKVVSQVR
jgi:glyoxylase-like metal-dependent hydrolase (beta-lactamase superfamily II)